MLIRESTLRRLIRQTLNEAASGKSETGSRSCDPPSLGDMNDDIWDALIGGPAPAGWRGALMSGLGDVKSLSQEGVKLWSAILAMAMHSSKLNEALRDELKVSTPPAALERARDGVRKKYKKMQDAGPSERASAAYAVLKKEYEDFKAQRDRLEKEYSTTYTPHPMEGPLRSGKPWTFENVGSQYTPEEREKITKVLQESLGVDPNGLMDAPTVTRIYNSLGDDEWVTITKLRRGRGQVVDPFCEVDDTELYKRAELIVKRDKAAYAARAIKDEAAGYSKAVQAQKKKQGPSKADLADPDDEFKFDK